MSLIFFGLLLILMPLDSSFEDSWINMVNPYTYYSAAIIMVFYSVLYLKKIKFHPSLLLLFVSIIMFASYYRIELEHIINFIILLAAYRILLGDSIVFKYRLLHILNVTTLAILLCV